MNSPVLPPKKTDKLSLDAVLCYGMSLLTGGSAIRTYTMKQPNAMMGPLAVGLGFGAAYAYAGYLLHMHRASVGHDIASVASLALVAAKGPTAMATMEQPFIAEAMAGTMTGLSMLYCSYLDRYAKTQRGTTVPVTAKAA